MLHKCYMEVLTNNLNNEGYNTCRSPRTSWLKYNVFEVDYCNKPIQIIKAVILLFLYTESMFNWRAAIILPFN